MAHETATLAGYVANLKFEDIPPDVRERAKALTLDFLGSAIRARRDAESTPSLLKMLEALALDGKGESTETILDWRPFDYFTSQSEDPSMKGVTRMHTYQLVPVDEGRATEIHYHFVMNAKIPRLIKKPLVNFMVVKMFKMRENLDTMARFSEEEYAALTSEAHETESVGESPTHHERA